MSRVVVLLVLIIVSTASAPPAAAQNFRDARLNLGPFYVTPGITLKELGWDSNIFNTETGTEVSDFTFTLSPKADAWLPFANRALIETKLELDMVWFSKYKDERGIDPIASLIGSLFFNRFTLEGGYEHRATRQRVNNEIDLRTHHVEGKALAGLTYHVSPKFSLLLSGDRTTTNVQQGAFFQGENLQENLDRMTGRAGVSASYVLTPLTTFTMGVERFADRFQYSSDRDSDGWTVLPRFEFKPRALIRGSVGVGITWFLPQEEAALPAFTGLVTDAELASTIRGQTIVTARWHRGVSYSFSSVAPYYIDNTFSFSVRQGLGRSFDILAMTDRSLYNYQTRFGTDVSDLPPGFSGSDDRVWSANVSLGYRLTREARLGAGIVYWVRRSDTGLVPDYERRQYTVSLTYGL